MWKLALRNLRSNLTRLTATALAVISGTAFVAAGLVLTQAISNAVSGSVDVQYGAVDVAVTAHETESGPGGTGVPSSVVDEVEGVAGVSAAAGDLAQPAKILGSDGDALRTQMMGRVWIVDDSLNPVTVVTGRAPRAEGEVAIDRGTAELFDLRVGRRVEMATPSGPVTARVVGITTFGEADSMDGGGTVFLSPEQGLAVLGAGSEQYQQVLVRTDGAPAPVMHRIESTVPANLEVITGGDFRERQTGPAESFVSFLRPVLLGFAFLALFVAAFVIYNTFTVVVTQRSRELALVRSVGGTPAQVRRSLLVEGIVLGAGASIIGLVVGLGLSLVVKWVLRRFDAPIPSAGLALTPGIVVLTLVSGTIITALAVLLPAVRAGRTKPVEAMREAEIDRSGTSRGRMWVGGTMLVVAAVLLAANRFLGTSPWLLGPGALLLFLGIVVGGPLLARLFGRAMEAISGRSLTNRLAADNMVRNPRRSATTANALVIGLFLVTLVTVAGTAFRDWAQGELAKLSSADFMVMGSTPISPDLLKDMRDIDGVRAVAGVRIAEVADLTGDTALLSGTDVDALRQTTGITADEGSLADVAAGRGAAVSAVGNLTFGGSAGTVEESGSSIPPTQPTTSTGEPATTERPQSSTTAPTLGGSEVPRVGDTLVLTDTEGNPVEVPVAASFTPDLNTIFLGTIVDDALFEKVAGDEPVRSAFIRADTDRTDDVGRRLDGLLRDYTGLEAMPGNFVGQIFGEVIDFLIAAVNGLLALSVLIALIGIVNTMNLSIHERRRELGMVRALGMTSSQVRSMVRREAFFIGLMGTVVGVGAGVLLGWIVVSSITASAVGVDWARVGIIVAVGVVISVLASLLPAHRAVRLDMLEAMAAT